MKRMAPIRYYSFTHLAAILQDFNLLLSLYQVFLICTTHILEELLCSHLILQA